MLAQGHVLAQHFLGVFFFFSLPAPKHVSCWRSFPNTSKLENAMSQVSTRKNPAKKMRRRKLQQKCNSESATLEVAFFLHFLLHLFWRRCILFSIFMFFFLRKKNNTKVDQSCKKTCKGENATSQVARYATQKMQRWKLHFFCIFPLRCFWHLHFPLHFLIFRICYN